MSESSPVLLRKPDIKDAGFILRLTNDPDWLRFIGDREIYSEADALEYMKLSDWINIVCLPESGEAVGVCGLLQRDYLDCPDIGFALLPEGRGRGLILSSARQVIDQASENGQTGALAGLVSPDNSASIKILEKLGMQRVGNLEVPNQAMPTLLYLNNNAFKIQLARR